MELDLEIEHPQNPTNTDTFKAFAVKVLIWLVIVIVMIAMFMFILWLGLFQNQKKLFSGINLYREPIIVQIGEEIREVGVFGTYSIILKPPLGDVLIRVSDKDGNVLNERTHTTTAASAVSLDYFSEDNTIKQCFITADVTNLFFKREEEAQKKEFELGHYYVISEQSSAGVYYEFDGHLGLVLAPGSYSGNDLPETIDLTDRISGVYPVDCESLTDKDALEEEIIWWTNYDPTLQKELLDQKLEEIANTGEYAN